MRQTDTEYLPYSARRYRISVLGEVFGPSGERLDNKDEDSQYTVELEWVLGKRWYNVGLLVLVTFHHVKLPMHLWDEIEPLYIDGDHTNNVPSNLTYRFKNGPLEADGMEGYYYIPFFTQYAISKDGVLFSLVSNKVKSWAKTKPVAARNAKGGYHYSRSLTDTGRSITLFRHRALCLTFKSYGEDIHDLVVNHKDGVPENDDLDNLEWSTYTKNNRHAISNGLRTKVKPVLMKNLDTGEILSFDNAAQCAKALGMGKGDVVRERIAEFPDVVRSDLMAFKYDDSTPWPEVNPDKVRLRRTGFDEDILARNVFTGEIVIFENSEAGERVLGINADTISLHLRENRNIPVYGYNFRYRRKNVDWPKHSKYHLAVYRDHPVKPPNGVFVEDLETGEETFYTSRGSVGKAFNLSKSRVHELIRNQLPFDNRYLFKHFDLRKNLWSDEEETSRSNAA